MSRFTPETRALADERIAQIEARGIECRMQHTYFDDEVCVHIYGNNNRALILDSACFIKWADSFLATPAPAAAGEHK